VSYPLNVLAPPQSRVACLECGRCCTYVAVGVNAPKSVRYATDVLWYLYHEKVSVHLDVDGDWAVVFETRCRNLEPDLRCKVYEHRPQICREFDDTGCEVNAPDQRDRVFTTPAEFLEFLKEWRPRVYRELARRFVPPQSSR
jgi:hypothetical protein